MILHPNDVTFTGFFKTGDKGTTKNAHTQEKREKYAKKQ